GTSLLQISSAVPPAETRSLIVSPVPDSRLGVRAGTCQAVVGLGPTVEVSRVFSATELQAVLVTGQAVAERGTVPAAEPVTDQAVAVELVIVPAAVPVRAREAAVAIVLAAVTSAAPVVAAIVAPSAVVPAASVAAAPARAAAVDPRA